VLGFLPGFGVSPLRPAPLQAQRRKPAENEHDSRLYDIDADPGEHLNPRPATHRLSLASKRLSITGRQRSRRGPPDAKRVPLEDEGVKERMRALGYLE
jgi:hypothetical protein